MHDSQGVGAAGAALIEAAARLFVVELDAPAIDALRHPDLVSVLEQLEPGVSSALDAASSSSPGGAAQLEELAAEFCRLFLMSKATSPMLSVWIEGEQLDTAQRLSAAVDGWQVRLEVELEQGPWGNLPRDHLAVSLGLYSLALVESESDLAEEIRAMALQPALTRFKAAVLEHSTSPIYRAGVRLLTELVG